MIGLTAAAAADLGRHLVERVCVGDILTRSAESHGDRPALIDGERVFSFRQLNSMANRFASALLAQGLQRGDVVGVMARNCAEMLIAYFGCAKAALICAPANLGLRPEEIAYCLKDSRAKVLIIEGVFAATAATLPSMLPDLQAVYWIGESAPDVPKTAGTFGALLDAGSPEEVEVYVGDRDAVQLLYTSGTTAHPKGVLTSHLAVTFTALSAALANRMTHETTSLIVLPLFHCALLNGGAVPAMTVGATAVLLPGFDPMKVASAIETHRVRSLVLLPMMYAALLQHPEVRGFDLSSVERAIYAMAPMPLERLKQIHELFPNADVVLGSGQTEFTPPTTFIRPEHQWSKAGSWGSPTVMTRVGVMDDEGNLLPRGEVGELVYRGPQVMNGYLNLPEETEKSFRFGWFHSGDVAWIDEDGVVWFTDRKKDMIKTGGENVASVEVERVLMEHPGVAEAAVIGVPHEYWGEAVCAVVVPKPEAVLDEEALRAFAHERLAGFKVPKAIRIVEALPRTGTGKIQKHILRQQLRTLFTGGKGEGS